MLDTLTNLFSNLGTPIKTFITALLTLIGLGFSAKPFINAMKDISDKKWVGGIVWLAAAIAIIAIPVLFAVFVIFGAKVGADVGTTFQ